MSVAIPWGYVDGLSEHLRVTTQMTTQEASTAALWIAQIAIGTAESALDLAKSHTNSMSADVRHDLTSSLNYTSEYLADDIAIVREYVSNTMLPAIEAMATVGGGVTDSIGEDIVKAYNAIGDSQEYAGEVIDKSIMATGDWISESYETVGNWIHEEFDKTVAIMNTSIGDILSIPGAIIDQAIDTLIPAEMQGLLGMAESVLTGSGMESLLGLMGKRLGEAMSSVFAFDEKDIKEWTLKMTNMLKEQMGAELG